MHNKLFYWTCHVISMFAGCTTIIALWALVLTAPVYFVIGKDVWLSQWHCLPFGPVMTWTVAWLLTAVLMKSGRITYESGYEKYL